MSMDTVVDSQDPTCYAVITEWESKKHLTTWLASNLCKDVSEKLNTVLTRPPTYREYREAQDDVFLL